MTPNRPNIRAPAWSERLNRLVRGVRLTDVRPACRPVLITALSRGSRRGISYTGDGPAAQGWWYDAGGLINSFLP